MSEEEISKAPAQDVTSTDVDSDNSGTDDSGPRVFDITPDLNIAPAKDDADGAPSIPAANIAPTTPTPPINIVPEPVKVEPKVEPAPPPKPQVPEPVSQFGPANPPAKTVGMNRISPNNNIEQSKPIEPANLQEAVATIKINPNQQATPLAKKPEPGPISDKPWLPTKDSKIKPLRTYETDFAEAMAKKRITTTSAIIAEDKRVEQQMQTAQTQETSQVAGQVVGPVPRPVSSPNYAKFQAEPITPKKDLFRNVQPPESPKEQVENSSNALRNTLLILISLLLVAGGSYAGYYLYKNSALALIYPPASSKNTNSDPKPTITTIESGSLLQVDSKVNIAIDNKNENQILSLIRTEVAKTDKEKAIKEIILTKTIENTSSKVTSKEILELIKIPVPDLITRSLTDDWMLGVYTGIGEQKHVFVVAKNNFFQNTFAGIIQWEKSMPTDLKAYTYSDSTGNNFTTLGKYKDRIIKNKDVREYVLDNGHISFLYSFVSNDKLIITDSEEALDEIIIRLEKNAFVR